MLTEQCFFDRNKAGIGMILRDAHGETQLAASLHEDNIYDHENVELADRFRGLQMCVGMGINKLILESDCLFI